jgi:thiol-disulfide isomerase/thioredoxin
VSRSAQSIRGLRVGGAVLLVLFGVWAGVRVYTGRAEHSGLGGQHLAAVTVPVGEASPPTESDFGAAFDPAVPTPAKIPERLPAFSLSDRAGKATPISTWVGKSLILNFWATWCAPCRREIPLLKSLYSEWNGRGVEVVGIAVDYRDKVAAYADELKIPYPLLLGEQDALDVAAQFGVDSPVFPFTVFTDRRGEVVTLYVGELHKAQADLILSVVANLNDNHVGLTEARQTIAEGLRALTANRPG